MQKTSVNKKAQEPKFDTLPDGSMDYLRVDPPVPGQNWACMSFISPEDMIQKRNLYYFNNFLYSEINKTLKDQAVHMAKEVNALIRKTFEAKIEKLEKSLNENDSLVAKQLKSVNEDMQIEEEEFAGRCMHLYKMDYDELHDKYQMYASQNATEMDKKFDQENDYKTSIRGFKFRGAYNQRKEADLKAKELRDMGEPVHVFVAPVGYWCPWDPNPDAIQNSEYMVPALNDLMGKYHENVKQKNQFFEERKQELVEDANKSNRERTKDRLRQKLMDRRQAKMEAEMKQSRRDAEESRDAKESRNAKEQGTESASVSSANTHKSKTLERADKAAKSLLDDINKGKLGKK